MLTVDYVEFGLMRTLLVVVDLIILGSLIYFLQVEIHSLCVCAICVSVYVCILVCIKKDTDRNQRRIKRPDIDRPIDQLDPVKNKKIDIVTFQRPSKPTKL